MASPPTLVGFSLFPRDLLKPAPETIPALLLCPVPFPLQALDGHHSISFQPYPDLRANGETEDQSPLDLVSHSKHALGWGPNHRTPGLMEDSAGSATRVVASPLPSCVVLSTSLPLSLRCLRRDGWSLRCGCRGRMKPEGTCERAWRPRV